MLQTKLIILLLLIPVRQTSGQSNRVGPEDQSGPLRTGVSYRDFADSSRSNWLGTGPRPVRSVIWYPAGQGGTPEIITDSSMFPAQWTLFRDAQIRRSGKKYPLILISHGSQGNADQMRWLGCYLASEGFISVAVNHNGTDEEERKTGLLGLTDFCMWERPRDLSAVLDKMLLDPQFSEEIDTSAIGCAGFSLGGATAIWVAGAIFNMEDLAKNEPEPPPVFKASIDRFIELEKTDSVINNSFRHSGDSFRDKRIKAVFALAPAIGQGFRAEGLKNITIPVQIVAGDADHIAPIQLNAGHLARNIPGARPLIILPGERGHYLTPVPAAQRASELREVSRLACHFFEEVLR